LGVRPAEDAVSEYHRRNTHASTVVLSPERWAMGVVEVSGRRTVAVTRGFSNPYVDWEGRAADRDRMYGHLAAEDDAAFLRLAARHGVSHILHGGGGMLLSGCRSLEKVFQGGEIALFAVRQQPPTPPDHEPDLGLRMVGGETVRGGEIPSFSIYGGSASDRVSLRFEVGIVAWHPMTYPVTLSELPAACDGSRTFEPVSASWEESHRGGLSWRTLSRHAAGYLAAAGSEPVMVRGRVERMGDDGRANAISRWSVWSIVP
jgi:hypothetical protein